MNFISYKNLMQFTVCIHAFLATTTSTRDQLAGLIHIIDHSSVAKPTAFLA